MMSKGKLRKLLMFLPLTTTMLIARMKMKKVEWKITRVSNICTVKTWSKTHFTFDPLPQDFQDILILSIFGRSFSLLLQLFEMF